MWLKTIFYFILILWAGWVVSLAWARPSDSTGLSRVSSQLAGQLAVDDLGLPHSHAWQLAGSWGNWVLLHEASQPPARWPGLDHMAFRAPNAARENSQSVFFKPLIASHLVTSHWPKQVTWLTHIKGMGKETPPLGGDGEL